MASESSRPLLLPQNRRIRHLRGIYLRNLTLERPHGQTIDDGVLNTTSSKLEALRSSPLHHSHSHSELRNLRPRRVSSNWSGTTPDFRQKKLENVIETRMADSFFTIHCDAQEEPIYISEVVEKAMNPTYRFFDLSDFGPAATRLDKFIVNIWVKHGDFVPLIEEEINLRSLQFIGTLENHSFPQNCILFHLIDGIYSVELASKPQAPKLVAPLPTSSYSSLMRLSNLEESIQDALATRQQIANQINAIIQDTPGDEYPQVQEDVALASRYLTTERKLMKQSLRRRTKLQKSLAARRAAMNSGIKAQSHANDDVTSAQEKLDGCQNLHTTTQSEIHGQRRRICEELLNIFPIEPTSQPLLFTICKLPLPNSTFEDADEDVLSAALGHAARVVDMLQYYLSVPLPYSITVSGSQSLIHDNISILDSNVRTFPLFPKSTIAFRFDYGVFLLNKDIEVLAESQGLKVIDIRQTLPNLKYLLYIVSAGSDELPARKRGGVRGLIGGWSGTPTHSRRGSDESGKEADITSSAVLSGSHGNGKTTAANQAKLPFGNDHRQSLRTSGLRENLVQR
ncbi:UV radiation resistance protein and autophagy-related subunit 14-domain-containing protein [Calycina marina]|uniref:Autophagy-related protein 14 n=1 Tax=Calycina marina TaxID=1763456 RepID=A0A9P7YY59_9HELO|nr:UV radiation resistance protein and autophagy-related subunit 14-domain-containing protein [Calycina marina]